MSQQITIEILGHKAKVCNIRGRLKDGLWRKEDCLEVRFELDEAVQSTLGFVIQLPVKNYGRDEFLEAMRREGEKTLAQILKRGEDQRAKRGQDKIRQGDLDSLAVQIQAMISK